MLFSFSFSFAFFIYTYLYKYCTECLNKISYSPIFCHLKNNFKENLKSNMSYLNKNSDNTSLHFCDICKKNIRINHKYILCNICNCNFHLKCNKTDPKAYEKIRNNDDTMFCLKCNEKILPFFPLNDSKCENKNFINSSNNIKLFFKSINEFQDNLSDEAENDLSPINCKYVDIENFKYKKSQDNFSLFHLNIASLTLHKQELETLLSMLNYKFDIIGITETKIMKNKVPIVDININEYKKFDTSTESEKGGVILYVNNDLVSNERKDLDNLIYKSFQLESVFVEIINKNGKNIICGCIYRHPSMDLNEFNQDFLNPLMEKTLKENKAIFLLGDFNADLLNYNSEVDITNFFDTLTSNLIVPHIILPTRITLTSKTLIDNIFSNSLNYQHGISGNLTMSISDHLAQFLIMPNCKVFMPKKSCSFKRDTKKFDKENFLLDLLGIDFCSVFSEYNNPNDCFSCLELEINKLADKYMPMKKLSKNEKNKALNLG